MVVDGKIKLLDKIVRKCFEKHNNPVLLFINNAKFYEDIPENACIKSKKIATMLDKVHLYKCKVYVLSEVVAEADIGFGEQ